MTWKVKLLTGAENDFNILDGSVKKAVLKQLVKLEINRCTTCRVCIGWSSFKLSWSVSIFLFV